MEWFGCDDLLPYDVKHTSYCEYVPEQHGPPFGHPPQPFTHTSQVAGFASSKSPWDLTSLHAQLQDGPSNDPDLVSEERITGPFSTLPQPFTHTSQIAGFASSKSPWDITSLEAQLQQSGRP